jgi:hypothetical protein
MLRQKDREDLRIVVRLTVEFYYFCQQNCTHQHCAGYMSGPVIWNFDSYSRLAQMYQILEDTTESTIDWSRISIPSIKKDFATMFRDFDNEIYFERKCRLLLDLYKLQIIFSAVAYETGVVSSQRMTCTGYFEGGPHSPFVYNSACVR